MIRVQQVKVPLKHTDSDIIKKACSTLHIKENAVLSYKIKKQSVDARRKNEVSYVYTIDLQLAHLAEEAKILAKCHSNNVSKAKDIKYLFPEPGTVPVRKRPVIVGSGPAGLFCAYILAEHGFCPLVIERGCDVETRTHDVEHFWETGSLKPNSNVQFGEGGAGTFSDGKLNTLVKDPSGRNQKVLQIFVECGAPEEILYVNKPHIGTDILKQVVKNLRGKIIEMGGSFAFETQLTDLEIEQGQISRLEIKHQEWMEAEAVVLAIGHSARDTFELLHRQQLAMEAKSFAVGMRVEHPQTMVNENQYKGAEMTYLPTASYKLTANLPNGRGVYSFCMCPGGYVVNASSEEGHLAVNGMSYHNRDGSNANSAIIVSVTPEDYQGVGPLAGVEFQRQLEEQAFHLGEGKIVQQLFGDFEANQVSTSYGKFVSMTKGNTTFANLRDMFSPELAESFIAGMHQFARYIPDFDRTDTILSGVESRTSSPVRITRDEYFESNIRGLYPCGEGAGYAGGIMSAAMDGLKVAEAIGAKYKPDFEKE